MTTPLRAKYIRDLAIRGRAERTQQSYSRYVSELARYYHRSPELIFYQEVADWLYYLVKERELSASSVNIAVNAVRFLYGVTLERNTDQLMASVLAVLPQNTLVFELHNRRRVRGMLVGVDDSRRGMVLLTQGFGQEALCCGRVLLGREKRRYHRKQVIITSSVN
jgi:integrase/recombinase XerD